MSYHEFIFRMPASTPSLTFASLTAYMNAVQPKRADRSRVKIGTTVELEHRLGAPPQGLGPCVRLSLYGTTLADIYPDHVYFAEHHDPHLATGEWLSKIAHDNGLGSVNRDRWVQYLYPGYDADGNRPPREPVEGHTFPVKVFCVRCAVTLEWQGDGYGHPLGVHGPSLPHDPDPAVGVRVSS